MHLFGHLTFLCSIFFRAHCPVEVTLNPLLLPVEHQRTHLWHLKDMLYNMQLNLYRTCKLI